MTEPRNPLEQALDFVVFAPIGLALTVVEDFPELAEKGRVRFQQRATTARMVGQFAVAEGRRRLQGPPPSRPPASAATPAPAPSPPVAAEEVVVPTPLAEPLAEPLLSPAPRSAARRPTPGAASGGPVPASLPVPPSDSLAIPGYDSLSASQVVQRLASLSSPELAAVRDYEAATRGRRTILARVSQLQV